MEAFWVEKKVEQRSRKREEEGESGRAEKKVRGERKKEG